jgi:hypothetical protein
MQPLSHERRAGIGIAGTFDVGRVPHGHFDFLEGLKDSDIVVAAWEERDDLFGSGRDGAHAGLNRRRIEALNYHPGSCLRDRSVQSF